MAVIYERSLFALAFSQLAVSLTTFGPPGCDLNCGRVVNSNTETSAASLMSFFFNRGRNRTNAAELARQTYDLLSRLDVANNPNPKVV